MELTSILAQVKAERDKLDIAISALEEVNSSGRAKKASGRGGGRRKHHMTAAGRKRLSLMMKRRWAQGKMGRKRKAA